VPVRRAGLPGTLWPAAQSVGADPAQLPGGYRRHLAVRAGRSRASLQAAGQLALQQWRGGAGRRAARLRPVPIAGLLRACTFAAGRTGLVTGSQPATPQRGLGGVPTKTPPVSQSAPVD